MAVFKAKDMDDIQGVALDAAVATALSVPDLVIRPNGQPATEDTFDPEGPAHEYDFKAFKMYRWFNPSYDGDLAMKLLTDHGMSLICEDTPNLDAKWCASWNPHSDDWTGLHGKHQEWGPTPQVAICRALVRRAKDQAYVARRDAHYTYWDGVMDTANARAFTATSSRKPHTEFASDDERAAYRWCMDYAAVYAKVVRGDLPRSAFDELPAMPPPFVDLDGTMRVELRDPAGFPDKWDGVERLAAFAGNSTL